MASVSALRDQHRAYIADRDCILGRLRKVIANHYTEATRLRRSDQDRETDPDLAVPDRDLAIADRTSF